jgi:hypothetical protein
VSFEALCSYMWHPYIDSLMGMTMVPGIINVRGCVVDNHLPGGVGGCKAVVIFQSLNDKSTLKSGHSRSMRRKKNS